MIGDRFTLVAILIVATLLTFSSCGGERFEKNEAGLLYYFVLNNQENPRPEVGDVMDIRVKYYVEDSLSMDNRLFLSLDSARHSGGSIETGLAMLHEGDSAIFKLKAKPFYLYSLRRPYPDEFDEDAELRFEVRLHGYKTKSEIEREREAIFNRNKMEEEKEIRRYADEKGLNQNNPMGLYITQLKGGTGKKVVPGKKVTVHYTGAFLTGQVFDSSLERNLPFSFEYGTGEVITAWEMGLKDARVGDRIQIVTPSWYAYADKGIEGIIPPNTPLLFEIEILETE